MPRSSLPLRSLLALAAISLVSCTTIDPGFAALEPSVETNPKSDAVVGMWHRNADYSDVLVSMKVRDSVLFSGNGTGMTKFLMTSGSEHYPSEAEFRWIYNGGGTWTVTYPKYPNQTTTVKTAQDQLLFYLANGSRTVYRRVE